MHTHPRIVIWYNTDPATWNKDKIPEGVDVIVHTRFVDHRLTERVNKIKPDGVRLLPIPFNTGMIKQALAAFGIQAITHPQAP
ncbi:hypothetical protein HY479_01080 [Candidatus Uhrbacteria bacterium]|nr:hypothetical protein [Candidatus Uhrbacteria bacterium]